MGQMIDYFLNQEVVRKYGVTYNKYGEAHTANSEAVMCRLHEKKKRIFNDKNEVAFYDAEMWVLPTQAVEVNDLIEYESKTYKVVGVDVKRDFSGNVQHKKALLNLHETQHAG